MTVSRTFRSAADLFADRIPIQFPLRAMLGAAEGAGQIARRSFGKSHQELGLEIKPDQTVLTVIDTTIQDFLIGRLQRSLGGELEGVAFLAEEKRQAPKQSNPKNVFIIDPIDGTKNFSSANPDFAIALAWAENAHSCLSVRSTVTLEPLIKRYTISCNEGTFQIDLKRQSVKKCALQKMDPNQVISLWGDIKDKTDGRVVAEMMQLLGKNGYEVRMRGSCVLTNAGVASGQYDGAIIYSGQKIYAYPWDIASSHQITKAGGIVSTMLGESDPLNNDPHSLVAGRNKGVHEMLLGIVREAHRTTNAPSICKRPPKLTHPAA